MAEIDGRFWPLIELAMDLLQYWELFLRYHVEFDCTDFCDAVRQALLPRVTSTVFRDAVRHALPQQTRPFVPLYPEAAEVAGKAISGRLTAIVDALADIEVHRDRISEFTARDEGDKDAKAGREFERVQRRYQKHKTELLSELFHLRDNVAKWLFAHARSQMQADRELEVINLRPYMVARHFVNTNKHGVSAKKPSAVVELYCEILAVPKGEQATLDDRFADVVEMINDDGRLFGITQLIDDVVQIWELFLRNHTDIDTRVFRVEIGKRLLAQRKGDHLQDYAPGRDRRNGTRIGSEDQGAGDLGDLVVPSR